MQYPVSIIGGINIDIKGIADSECKEADSYPGEVNFSPGGVAANIARNLSQLGVPVRLFGCTGDDQFGEIIRMKLKLKELDTNKILIISGQSTSVYLSVSNKSHSFFYAVNDTDNMAGLITPDFIDKNTDTLKESSMIVLDTNLSAEVLDKAVSFSNKNKIPVFISVVSAEKAERVNKISGFVNYLSVNRTEFKKIFGSHKNIEVLHDRMENGTFDKYGYVIIKKDIDGADIIDMDKNFIFNCLAPDITVRDVCGAGDAFDAGYIFSQLNKNLIKEFPENIQLLINVNPGYIASCAAGIALNSKDSVSPELNRKNLISLIKKNVRN